MGHFLISNGKVVALVTRDCYGKRKEIGCADLMGQYTPEQLKAMRQIMPEAYSLQQSNSILGSRPMARSL
jgi:hypothetical protein